MTLQIDAARLSAPESLLADVADVPPESDKLGEWLEATLKNELGLATVERDEDGDIPVMCDEAVVYVRQGEPESTFLTVAALLLEDFLMAPELFEAVNAINVQMPMAKTVVDVDRQQIVVSVDLPVIDTLSPHDLMLAIETVADAVDYYGTLLQNRFGGATARQV
jgi:Putative bacterial sensory transduction regulator